MPSRRVRSAREYLLRTERSIQEEVIEAMREFGDLAIQEHEAVVKNWEHEPEFRPVIGFMFKLLTVDIVAHGKHAKIWLYVDQGTPPHIITPKRIGGLLKFKLDYDAKTEPVGKFNQGTGESFGSWISTKIVNHPGTKARKFTEDIAEKLTPEFRRLIENAFRRSIRRANRR